MPTTTATKTTASPATAKGAKPRKPLPAPNSDFYYLYETLPTEELAIVKRAREFMETKVAPVITDYWVRDEFPFDLLPAVKELGIGGVEARERGIRGALRSAEAKEAFTAFMEKRKPNFARANEIEPFRAA